MIVVFLAVVITLETVAIIGLLQKLKAADELIDLLDNENKKQHTAIQGMQARLYSETLRSKQD